MERASQQPNACLTITQCLTIFSTLDAIHGYSSKMLERLQAASGVVV